MDKLIAWTMYKVGNSLLSNYFPNITDMTTDLCLSKSVRCWNYNMNYYYKPKDMDIETACRLTADIMPN